MDSDLKGKRVVILGLARQGTAAARFLARAGAEVTVSDRRDEATLGSQIAALEGLPIRFVLGDHPPALLDGADLLCLSGGVPVDVPIAVEAQRRGVPLSNDAQLFLERCPAPVIGITGSAGKTTTTALTGEALSAAGRRTWVGGNIGNPLITDLTEMGPDDWVVMELSSFQLELTSSSPHVAAVLNVTPNHLDRHGEMQVYVEIKRKIVANQGGSDYAVLGRDDANARAMAEHTAAEVIWFSGESEVEQGAFRRDDRLVLRIGGMERDVCEVSQVQLRGDHNLLNVLAASALAGAAGVPVEAIAQAVAGFTGVEHRLELVRELNGVRWYDDSIATAPERTLAALRSFEEPIVLLAGGRDKKLPWDVFAEEAVRRVRYLVTFGEAGSMIAGVVDGKLSDRAGTQKAGLAGITQVVTLEEAVEVAAGIVRPGDVVLLSPGGTSFDAFCDFAERGDRFKDLVQQLAASTAHLN